MMRYHDLIQKENIEALSKHKSDVSFNKESICQFFLRTGSCQYGQLCCKQHLSPKASSTLVFKNMLRDPFPSIRKLQLPFQRQKFLSPESEEIHLPKRTPKNQQFLKFFKDIYPEFEKFGKVRKVLVCNNNNPHLRGNVYVFFANIQEGIECYNKMVGRFYGGLPLVVEYSYLVSGNEAICQFRKKCPRFDECNFLHIYQNPKILCRSRSPRKSLYE